MICFDLLEWELNGVNPFTYDTEDGRNAAPVGTVTIGNAETL